MKKLNKKILKIIKKFNVKKFKQKMKNKKKMYIYF